MRMVIAGTMSLLRILLVGALASVTGMGCASSRNIDAGPLYSERPDFFGQEGVRALGPLLERRVSGRGDTFTAVRPFWSRVEAVAAERTVQDVLWPVGMFKTRQGELDWRFLMAFGHDFDSEISPSRMRWSLFPILFGGRDATGNGYFSIFPLGGTLREFLGRERIWFVLFPLYSQSWQADNHTTSVLWPVYSRTVGGDISRWRVWPFYGVSHNHRSWTKRFVFWPIWTSVRYHDPEEAGGGFILFPLYGQIDLPERKSRMFLPPLFKVEWGETGHFAMNAPWPFLQYARNAQLERLYVFPIWGKRRLVEDRSWFLLWPVISGHHVTRPKEVLTRFRVLPFWQYERVRSREDAPAAVSETLDAAVSKTADAAAGQTLRHYMRLWPLGMYRNEQGQSLLRVPDLWPLRQTPGVERNWAPLWTLYRRDWNATHAVSELLWGAVRWERAPDERSWHLFPLVEASRGTAERSWRFLYGLIGYERDGLQTSYQLLYFMRIRRSVDSAKVSAREQEGEEP